MEQPQLQQITVPTKDTKQVHCGKCGSKNFQKIWQVRKIPAIHPQNPSGQTLYVQDAMLMCMSCKRTTKLDGSIEEKGNKH